MGELDHEEQAANRKTRDRSVAMRFFDMFAPKYQPLYTLY